MKTWIYVIFFTLLTQIPELAGAYELFTHAAITQAAFARSLLNDAGFRSDLGMPEAPEPFGNVYFDVSGANEVRQRHDWDFEGSIINHLGVDKLSLKGWLMRGAIREDDMQSTSSLVGIFVKNPQDDTYSSNASLIRPLHHFFDPYFNQPLNTTGVSLLDSAYTRRQIGQ